MVGTQPSTSNKSKQRHGVAIISCIPPSLSSMPDGSVASTLKKSPGASQKNSKNFFQRLKKRQGISDIWPPSSSSHQGPIVLKIGGSEYSLNAAPSTIRSIASTSTPYSTMGFTNSSRLSTLSSGTGLTIRYEDLESIANGNYCCDMMQMETCFKSVISVESLASSNDTIEAQPPATVAPPSAENNVQITQISIGDDPPQAEPVEQMESDQPVRDSNSDPQLSHNGNVPPEFIPPPTHCGPHHTNFPPNGPSFLGPRLFGAHAFDMGPWHQNLRFDNNVDDLTTNASRRQHRFLADLPGFGAGLERGNTMSAEEMLRFFPPPRNPSNHEMWDRVDESEWNSRESNTCCGGLLPAPQSKLIGWFILLISLIGLACLLVGITLGGLTASGEARWTVSLLMIGVGSALLTVSGVAWRLTVADGFSCCVLRPRRSRAAIRPHYYRVRNAPQPPHPMPGVLCPEFFLPPPPPTYQLSMEEARLRELVNMAHSAERRHVGSPPPTYRSEAPQGRPGISDLIDPPSSSTQEDTTACGNQQDSGQPGAIPREPDCPPGVIADASDPIVVNEQQRLVHHRTHPGPPLPPDMPHLPPMILPNVMLPDAAHVCCDMLRHDPRNGRHQRRRTFNSAAPGRGSIPIPARPFLTANGRGDRHFLPMCYLPRPHMLHNIQPAGTATSNNEGL